MTEPDFWKSTAFAVIQAYNAAQENLSRLAYRTAIYQRMNHKHLPKNEEAIFAKAKPARKSKKQAAPIDHQLRMAQAITLAMGGSLH